MGCTVVLTIVGVVKTMVAVKTLGEIKEQVGIMRNQAKSLEGVYKAADENARLLR